MCNEIRRRVALGEIRDAFSALRIPLVFPEGLPNLAAADSVRITDPNPIVRAAPQGEGAAELVVRRWSWPMANGRPVYNLRSEGRSFGANRCLVIADGFYEFTAPEDPAARRKSKWLFTKRGENLLAIAGIWRASPVGEAFTLLTAEPGPDVAPYHHRQIVILEQADWARWLDPATPSADLLVPRPAGTLEATRIR
jgi:putative SOS response-associated peptidase YedK